MKKYISIILGLLIVPSIASAAWWNPTTWFGEANSVTSISASSSPEVSSLTAVIAQQSAEISQLQAELASTSSQAPTVVTKTTTQTVKDPTEEADITSLTQQLAAAQTQYNICKGQLSSVNSGTQASSPASGSNSTKIASIQNEIANLSQIDFDIDNDPLGGNAGNLVLDPTIGTTTLVYVLNTSMKLDGTPLFPTTLGSWYVTLSNGLQPATTLATLHQTVARYREQLDLQLEGMGDITNTVSLPQ